MAAPHVSGAVALLLQRHPTWTPAQVKSALALTGDPAYTNEAKADEVPTLRGGGGVINLPRADATPIFSSPRLVQLRADPLQRVPDPLRAADGLGPWRQRAVDRDGRGAEPAGRRHTRRAGHRDRARQARRTVRTTQASRRRGDRLSRAHARHGAARIPYWFGTGTPALATAKPVALRSRAATRPRRRAAPRASRATATRRARSASASAVPPGPERVFRVTLPRPAVNFGVVVTSRAQRVRVEPRIVRAGDERRLTGYAALPVQPEPVPAHVRRARARRRHDPAGGRPVRRRLRQPVGRARRRVHVPLLGQRRHAAGPDARGREA